MKENSITFPVIVVVFLAALMAYGVSWYAKNNSDLSSKITPEQLASFTAEDIEYVELPPLGSEELFVSPVELRQKQAARYDDIGQAVKSLNIGNIAAATPEDLRLIGETAWSLTNTVAANLKFPQIIELIFNNKNVLEGFFSREGVLELTNNYLTVTDLVVNNSPEVSDLIESNAFKGIIKDKELMTKILNSALIQEILLSRSGNYFLSNPMEAKKLIENNEILAPLLKEENLKNVLLSDPKTENFAIAVFPTQN